MKSMILFVTLLFLFVGCKAPNNNEDLLRAQIAQIVLDKAATVGVFIIGNEGQDTISINGDKPCPLQSVFKMHISLAVLSEIDKGKLTLDQKIEIPKEDLKPDLWSPLRDDHPEGGSFTIASLIQYSVSQSDNVACDALIRLIGTPKTVEEYFKKNQINDIAISFNEEDMQSKWENMFENWTTPKAASETLQKFHDHNNQLLSKNSHDFFWQTMKETTTGDKRLRGFLPKGTVVAHKTGTSGTNNEGLTAAINDIGIVFLPNGKHFIISVFITDSTENNETNEKIIADISKATYEFYTIDLNK